jgi:hypothetical protein
MNKVEAILYNRFNTMKSRCYNENFPKYQLYGKRGIKICEEWLTSFNCFFDWCISNGWSVKKQLDRIDGERGYSPDNCRIVTPLENSRNTRGKGGSSKYKGVNFKKSAGKWCSRIMVEGTSIHIGYFKDEKEAAIAYDNKAKELFGEFAYLNFKGE